MLNLSGFYLQLPTHAKWILPRRLRLPEEAEFLPEPLLCQVLRVSDLKHLKKNESVCDICASNFKVLSD